MARTSPDVLFLWILWRRADVESGQGVLIKFVGATHRVKLDMVSDGRAIDVEVITAWFGAKEAFKSRGHLFSGACDVGLDDIGEEDSITQRGVPVRLAEIRNGKHGTSRGN